MSICGEISKFYREDIACRETTASPNGPGATEKILPITRLNFNTGAGLAILFLVQKIAMSIFFLAGVIVTCGLYQDVRASLSRNVKGGLVYAGVISLGFIGVLFPQTVNQKILQIPSHGLIIPNPN
jgi:hypothetical protein